MFLWFCPFRSPALTFLFSTDACWLTLDPNTAHKHLSLSDGYRRATYRWGEDQSYPDHPERFDRLDQALCREGLSSRCYWEAEWTGSWVLIGAAYKTIGRKGKSNSSKLGHSETSWSLCCSDRRYSVCHNNESTDVPVPHSLSHRVGVYLDWLAGTLSFYSVFSDTLTHLHTFHTTFTQPLYAGFSLGLELNVRNAHRLDAWEESSSLSLS